MQDYACNYMFVSSNNTSTKDRHLNEMMSCKHKIYSYKLDKRSIDKKLNYQNKHKNKLVLATEFILISTKALFQSIKSVKLRLNTY